MHLPNLEVFLCCDIDFSFESLQLKTAILRSAKQLRVLRARIQDQDVEDIQLVCPSTDVFRHLIALDLTGFSESVLETLVGIPDLQLTYLRLTDSDIENCS